MQYPVNRFMKIFKINLRRERLLAGYTQQYMAEKLNIMLRAYQAYESLGKSGRTPDLEMVVRIAEVLDITTDELLGKKT